MSIFCLAQPPFEVFEVGRKAKNGHDLGSDGNIVSRFSWHAVDRAAEPDSNVSQGAIIHVDHPAPGDTPRIEIECVLPMHVIVD